MEPALLGGLHEWNITFVLETFDGLERLQLISLSLEGHVLNWFNGEMDNDPFADWIQFKRRFISWFRQ